jgi:hypothetical protein
MTRARGQIVDSSAPGFYHCVSRCVRRAWLCGVHPYSKPSCEHRRQWVEDRLLQLVDIFAVALHAYAVMSNHLHVVLQIDPGGAGQWTDEVVAERWVRLFPVTSEGGIDVEACALKRSALLGNADRLTQWRDCLGDLGWFMRCLNEHAYMRLRGAGARYARPSDSPRQRAGLRKRLRLGTSLSNRMNPRLFEAVAEDVVGQWRTQRASTDIRSQCCTQVEATVVSFGCHGLQLRL